MNGIREFSAAGFIFTYVQKYLSGPLMGAIALYLMLTSPRGWRRDIMVTVVSGVCHTNEVTLRRAWLVLGWVTVCGWYRYLSSKLCHLSCIPPGLLCHSVDLTLVFYL